ncbi:MAG: phosphoribosylanthranilate isomerase [Lachnospiraceae bacterium]|nr:phosphoribosylanthranilate isomerase [Lachnospiraceae bacterium]
MSENSVKIKICGLSRPVDIDYVNEAEPDYCGFIINVPKSIRNTTPDQVRALRKNLSPKIIPVGVFRNAPVETAAELLLDGTISVAQLHGSEDEDYIHKLRTFGAFTIFKAFRVPSLPNDSGKDGFAAKTLPTGSGKEGFADRALTTVSGKTDSVGRMSPSAGFETYDAELSRWADAVNNSSADMVLLDNGGGGTGKTFDWQLAERIKRPYILAGGIGPDNIAEAVKTLHPWCIDMSSSVETDGKKDRGKILDAVRILRTVEMNRRAEENRRIRLEQYGRVSSEFLKRAEAIQEKYRKMNPEDTQ